MIPHADHNTMITPVDLEHREHPPDPEDVAFERNVIDPALAPEEPTDEDIEDEENSE